MEWKQAGNFVGMCCSTGGIEDVSAFPVKRWLPTAWCRLAGGFRGAGKARFVELLYWLEILRYLG